MIRCSCGYALTYETDICPNCLPNGLYPALPPPSPSVEYERGFVAGVRMAIQAITEDRIEHQPLHYWDGMRRAVAAAEALLRAHDATQDAL